MNTGQLISGLAHVGLIGVAFFGGAFRSEPLPFEVTEVTAISSEEYAALVARPEPEALATIETPEAPDAGETLIETPQEDAAPSAGPSALSEIEPPDTVPEPLSEPEPPQPPDDLAALAPEPEPEVAPEPAPRVAPEPVAQPDPDVEIDDVDRQATEADEQAETPLPDEPETAREAAASRIVTEADRAEAAAPAQSVRPKPRPAAAPEPETEPETETAEAPPTPDAVDAALSEALGGATEPAAGQNTSAAQGPPLTAGEKDGLRIAVQECWNVGALSSDALSTTVVVAVTLQEDGRPVTNSIEMIDATGGTASSVRQAFEAARRAIIRCGSRGYDLPSEKYASWRDIEMTFNPERMRIK
ncbi:MAG: energy transducer TonB [Pseudomonadota bacterium]